MSEALEKTPVERGQTVVEMVAHAISHWIRVQILFVLNEGIYSPTEVAEIIDVPLNSVSNHMRSLADRGSIEIVDTRMRRNAAQHFYRATQRLYFDEDSWQELGEKEQLDLSSVTLRMISQDITSSMAAGIFFADGNAHMSRQSMIVDEEGWAEAIEVLERASAELFAVEARVAERIADGAPAEISANDPVAIPVPSFSTTRRTAAPIETRAVWVWPRGVLDSLTA